jgi:outer membrane protein TolC
MLLVNPSIVFADDEVLKISLKDAIDMAIETSEDVQIKDNEVIRSNSQVREERSELFPHVSGIAIWSRNYEYPDIPATALTKEYDFNVGATLDQKLFTFGRISSAISAARKQLEASQWNKETTNQEVVYITKLAYYNAYLAKCTLEIVQESYGRVQENKGILESRSSSGRASKYDNIKMAADIASRIPMVSNARANLNSALETLKRVIGVDTNVNIDITDNFATEYQTFNKEDLIRNLLEKQPTLKALEKNIDAAQDTIWGKKAEYLPELSAFSTWNHKGSGNEYDIRSENLHDYGVVGLKVSMPIWEGGKRNEELQQAKIDKSNAELNLQKMTKDLQLELDAAVVVYNEFVETLHSYEDAVRLAEESFKLSQNMFQSGHISITDLNSAELLLTKEKINKETVLFNINETLAKIEKLTVSELIDE